VRQGRRAGFPPISSGRPRSGKALKIGIPRRSGKTRGGGGGNRLPTPGRRHRPRLRPARHSSESRRNLVRTSSAAHQKLVRNSPETRRLPPAVFAQPVDPPRFRPGEFFYLSSFLIIFAGNPLTRRRTAARAGRRRRAVGWKRRIASPHAKRRDGPRSLFTMSKSENRYWNKCRTHSGARVKRETGASNVPAWPDASTSSA